MRHEKVRPAFAKAVEEFFNASALLDAMRLRIWDSEGLTVTQLRLLRFLSEEEGLSNAELAERLLVTRPSVSALLERLERGGFIRREVAANDRRGISIFLEERGRNAVSTLRSESADYVGRLMEFLSDEEIEALASSLARFVESGRRHRRLELQAESAHTP
jgi:DNA-binding MarR family transcriptional regulator